MGCGASRAKDQEEDEYYEEETRSVQTSARLHRTLMTPRTSGDDGRPQTKTDKSIESEKWDTFEIASSERGNTAKDSGYGRERSADRIMLAKMDVAHSNVGEMGHPNRVHSPVRRERIHSSPNSQRRDRQSPPPRARRRSGDDRGRRHSPQTDRRNVHRQLSRNYDSDPDELERRRRRSIDEARRRRAEDDFDEGYRSGANSNNQRTHLPRSDNPNMVRRDSTRRPNHPPSEPSRQSIPRVNPNLRRPRSAPDDEGKRRPSDKNASNKLYQRRPNQHNEQNTPRTKSISSNNQKIHSSPKKANTLSHPNNWNSDIRVADPKNKKAPAPPPWKLAYTGSKPAWSSDIL